MVTPLRAGVAVTLLALGLRAALPAGWPAPFHPTVQYDAALAARAMWLAADPAARTGDRADWYAAVGFGHVIAPPVLPALTAGLYLLAGGETPAASRVFGGLFWVAAGWLVMRAVVRQTGRPWPGVAALAWFVLCPFGLRVSHAFMAEPVLAFALATAVWHLSRPDRSLTWRQTVASGLLCGACALVKPGVTFAPLLAGFAAGLPPPPGGRPRKLAHLAVFAGLLVLPSALYVRLVLAGRGGELMPDLLAERWFYVGVWRMATTAVGLPALLAGVAGAVLAARAGSRLLPALLVGHLGTVAVFTFHCATHDYYHVPLMVFAAVGLGWVWSARLPRWAGLLLLVVCLEPWRDPAVYRDPPPSADRDAAYDAARAAVGPGARVVAVTEDYGLPFEYRTSLPVAFWPRAADIPAMTRAGILPLPFTPDGDLAKLAADGYTFAVVTDFAEWDRQPDLRAALARRGRVVLDRPGLLVFDLRPP
ncbi:MAG: hypothetical protein K2X87_30390 [Gemmataceae bacterium]|nr:hypothetical protein [Gemmataceae bacterium]